MKIREKLILVESVASNSITISHVDMMLRFFIAKDILKVPMNFGEETDVADVYDELELENDSFFELYPKEKYNELYTICLERYKEIKNFITFDKLQELNKLTKSVN